MKTSFTSNLSVQNAMRSTVNSIQTDLIDSQKEVVSGTYSDIGKELGATSTRSVNLHRDVSMMNNLMSTNAVVTQRLSSTQTALETIASAAQTGLNTLVALSGSQDQTQLDTAVQTMTDVLDQFTAAANTSVNGEYVLAGINTDEKPLNDYKTDEGGAKTAFDDAFEGYFGFAQDDDDQTATITAADMDSFLTDVVEPMFDSDNPDWTDTWSTASDTAVTSRISKTEVVQTSATTNSDGFRNLAMATVVSKELLAANLSSDTRAVLSNKAVGYMGQAITGIDADRSLLGLSQNRVTTANDTLQSQVDIMKLNLDDLEGVDVYEASSRITALTNQMEISYNLTAKLNDLSLVNEL
jgi:flagellar hook-associated protein 3 FlgL